MQYLVVVVVVVVAMMQYNPRLPISPDNDREATLIKRLGEFARQRNEIDVANKDTVQYSTVQYNRTPVCHNSVVSHLCYQNTHRHCERARADCAPLELV